MNSANNISLPSLVLSSSLVFMTLFFSYWQKLKLEKDLIISLIRAVIQLSVIGYVLNLFFHYDNSLFTALLLLFMIFNAAHNASKRGQGIKNSFFISFLSIGIGSILTLFILILSKAIQFVPYQVIPVSGMIIGNAMISLGLCYKQLSSAFTNRREEVETKLSLGADILLSSRTILRDAIKTGMLPSIDSAKTLGVVSLPGMMTGLILAGYPPMVAIKYQIMVTFMLISATSISSLIACYLAYSKFFNSRKQLLDINSP